MLQILTNHLILLSYQPESRTRRRECNCQTCVMGGSQRNTNKQTWVVVNEIRTNKHMKKRSTLSMYTNNDNQKHKKKNNNNDIENNTTPKRRRGSTTTTIPTPTSTPTPRKLADTYVIQKMSTHPPQYHAVHDRHQPSSR